MTTLKKFLHSFIYALNGIFYALSTQRNMKIHAIALTFLLVFGYYFQLSLTEWSLVSLAAGLVISAELFNTAIENICDLLKNKLKLNFTDTTHARDLSAGAVLIASIVALVVGLIIFIPKFTALFFI